MKLKSGLTIGLVAIIAIIVGGATVATLATTTTSSTSTTSLTTTSTTFVESSSSYSSTSEESSTTTQQANASGTLTVSCSNCTPKISGQSDYLVTVGWDMSYGYDNSNLDNISQYQSQANGTNHYLVTTLSAGVPFDHWFANWLVQDESASGGVLTVNFSVANAQGYVFSKSTSSFPDIVQGNYSSDNVYSAMTASAIDPVTTQTTSSSLALTTSSSSIITSSGSTSTTTSHQQTTTTTASTTTSIGTTTSTSSQSTTSSTANALQLVDPETSFVYNQSIPGGIVPPDIYQIFYNNTANTEIQPLPANLSCGTYLFGAIFITNHYQDGQGGTYGNLTIKMIVDNQAVLTKVEPLLLNATEQTVTFNGTVCDLNWQVLRS